MVVIINDQTRIEIYIVLWYSAYEHLTQCLQTKLVLTQVITYKYESSVFILIDNVFMNIDGPISIRIIM